MTFLPTDADIDDALQRVVNLAKDLYDSNADGADSAYDNAAAVLANVDYPLSENVRNGAIAFRQLLGSSIPSFVKPALDAVLMAYLTLAGSTAQSPEAGWADLVKYFVDNGKTITARVLSVGSITKVGGTGTPTFRVLRVDKYGEDIQSIFPTTYEIECTNAQPQTSIGQETLSFYSPPRIDLFSLLHTADSPAESGGDGRRTTVSVNVDQGLIRDASFEFNRAAAAAGALSSLGAWTPDDATTLARCAIIADGYRSSAAERALFNAAPLTNPSVQCLEAAAAQGNISISQPLRGVNPNIPYDAGVWVKRRNSATGNVVLTMGNIQTTHVIGDLTNDVWTFLPFLQAVGVAPSLNNWPDNFAVADNPVIRIATTSLATGQIRFDAVEVRPMVQVNSLFVAAQPGATPLQTNYTATWALSITTEAVIQFWLWAVYGVLRFLPSVRPTATITASGGRTFTFATADDTITASSGSFISDGFEVGMKLVSALTSSNNGTFTLTDVTATVLTVAENLTDEGPLSSTATLTAHPTIVDP